MFGAAPSRLPQQIGFLLLPNFSMIAFASAVESLRLANRTSGRALYAWTLISRDGQPVKASNGISFNPDASIDTAPAVEMLILCSGIGGHLYTDKAAFSWLRRLDRQGTIIGALCTGSHVLARAGLLDGYRCTIHWENITSFTEEFPEIEVTNELFEIDGNRFTCSGGTAALDLMLNLIGRQHGHTLATAVSDQFIHERIRDEHDHQRMALTARLGVRHPKLIQVIKLMEQNLEEPLDRADLAQRVDLSTRQLERLFGKYLSRSPARYYLELRLGRARLLLLQTNMSVIDVALACGFVSASHFSKCYRDFFGKTPRKERGLPPASGAEPVVERRTGA
ncbi:MAG TPA: GlxA family transcriptional regulator [Alphaproteobacteria bacterium]|nr:GlxA family transcriptional regulator [Alphaproteobacteria bacterium]